MLFSWFAVAVFGIALAPISNARDIQQITLGCEKPHRVTLEASADSGAELHVLAKERAWLEVDESGLEVRFDEPAPESVFEIPTPPRYAWAFVSVAPEEHVTLRRVQRGDPRGSVLLTLHCESNVELSKHLTWLKRATVVSKQINAPSQLSANTNRTLSAIDELIESSPDEKTRSFAAHLRAQALLFADQSRDAAKAFAFAEAAWIRIGDTDRARLARVARVEGLVLSGGFPEVLALTRSFPGTPSATSYFSIRLERSRCLALAYLGHVVQAEFCYQWVLARLAASNELGEHANTLQAYAGLEIDRGNLDHAEKLVQIALAEAEGVDTTLYRGRLHVLLADIALRRGAIGEALNHSVLALAEFNQAQAPRWEANTMLKLAQLHDELGDYDEALGFLAQALKRISARDAPTRFALALHIFAEIERDRHHSMSALVWLRAAEQIYQRLGTPDELEDMTITDLELNLERRNIAAVAEALGKHPDWRPHQTSRSQILMAEVALVQSRLVDARATLDRLQHMPLRLRDQIRVAALEASYRYATGATELGQRNLFDAGKRITSLSGQSGSPILRYLISRQNRALRRSSFSIELQSPRRRSLTTSIDSIWNWMILAPSSSRVAIKHSSAEAFDRAVAADLLGITTATKAFGETPAQHELLSLLVQSALPQGTTTAVQPVSLDAFRAQLDPNSAFMAFLDGDQHGALLVLTRDSQKLIDTASPEEVRANIIALRDLVRSPDSPVTDIRVVARKLSEQLFHQVSLAQPPEHLYVFAEEPLNGVPWAVLTWPGTSSFLLDTTTIELVRLDTVRSNFLAPLPKTLDILVAAQRGNTLALPSLAGAEAESTVVASSISRSTLRVRAHIASRAAVLSALHDPDAWVHVATHGIAQAQRIGYAGIWLEQSGYDAMPPFLSWIDVLDSGVSADLVVLNACQLADSGTAVNGNLSFADAVSRAGAKHVVASLWPVSDAASALWVPAFYGAITADPYHDPAAALRAAQLRLRESRAFRHPFFWAGMQVIDRMSIGSKATH